ncbi:MAG: hypothetical protein ABFS03_09725 [Chloroflexota bacterium]
MPKDIRVLLIENDPYARDLMALLLTRDWRTRVVAEIADPSRLSQYLSQPDTKIDVVILDAEPSTASGLPYELAKMTQTLTPAPAVIYMASQINHDTLDQFLTARSGGYILKSELFYGLASAAALAADGNCVISPGIEQKLGSVDFPEHTYILDGRTMLERFTPRERELVRFKLIFNLSTRDLVDELVLSASWISEMMSIIYQKLGLRDILSGSESLEDYFNDEVVLAHSREILSSNHSSTRKAPWMATLAFHLLTVPEIQKI